jgi:hypothetical protein
MSIQSANSFSKALIEAFYPIFRKFHPIHSFLKEDCLSLKKKRLNHESYPKKLRITEWSLALLFTVLYNVVHLSRVIKYFDNEIGKVQNYEYILMDYTSFWDAVREYDTIKYINLPTIIAAAFFCCLDTFTLFYGSQNCQKGV